MRVVCHLSVTVDSNFVKHAIAYRRVAVQHMDHWGVVVVLALLDWTGDVAATACIRIAQRELDRNPRNYAMHH